MKLTEAAAIKPLLYAIGVLLLACVGLGVALYVQGKGHKAEVATLKAERDGFEFASHAWEAKADEAITANAAFVTANGQLRDLLAEAQGEITRLTDAGRAAVDAAQAEADEANRTLAAWTSKYAAQVRMGDCAAALNAVQTACPAMKDY